jgi:hypothetical protein
MTIARDTHRQLDRAFAESEARDGDDLEDRQIMRPRRWRQDSAVSGGPQSKVLVLKLRQRVSARGNTYLDGWMGQAKLLGFKEVEPDEYGNEVWSVYAVTPQPKAGK